MANSSSIVSATTPWPNLEVDLCRLALGADTAWGTPDHYLPQPKPVNTQQRYSTVPGCYNAAARTYLTMAPIYVCPGPHRDRSLTTKCGYAPDYYCASWGCETTGDTYWNPSARWDYITVKRKNPPTQQLNSGPTPLNRNCVHNWCNPLVISFTEAGREQHWEGRGYEWGLRLYLKGKNPGLTFKIRLLKSIPNQQNNVAVGPNSELHRNNPAQSPRKIIAGLITPRAPPPPYPKTPAGLDTLRAPPPARPVFQPTLPAGPPSTANLILTLVNTSVQAIHGANFTLLEECWVCYSSTPPFYEGITNFKRLLFTNDTSSLRWSPPEKQGLTLNKVSGLGLCLIGPNMLPPKALTKVYNQTLVVNSSSQYISTSNNTYLACSSGLTTFIVTQVFLLKRDYCVQVALLPHLIFYEVEEFLRLWEKGAGTLSRTKREPITAITLAVIIGLGAAGAGTGVASLITSNQQYNQLSATVDKDIQELQLGLKNLKDSVTSLSEVVLQNRRGLDLLFLQQGGLCAALKEECCFYTDKTGLVEDSLQKVRKRLEKRKRERETQKGWFESWYFQSPWMTTLFSALAGPVLFVCLALIFGPYIVNKGIAFIQNRIDAVKLMVIQRQYQPIVRFETELRDTGI